jgi:hypothetical protein
MKSTFRHGLTVAIASTVLIGGGMAAQAASLPRLQAAGASKQLLVDDKPFIGLSGEVHNSTGSSPAYMAPIWDQLKAANLNMVISAAYWELLEPQEGHYDFTVIDDQINQARAHNMRLVFLWFGTLKNAGSSYAPGWVRQDSKRFPRAVINQNGPVGRRGVAPLSVFSDATATADARAFAKLMEHIAQVDPDHTVITVQVENETGILGDSRDRSPVAEAAWRGQVPADLMKALLSRKGKLLAPSLEAAWKRGGYRMTGTWAEVFGADWQGEEIFMAWGVSRLVDKVAAAGKAKLALPMYANAWLGPQKEGDIAGAYPTGGPIPRVFDIWKANAPHIDWIGPDIYSGDFATVAKEYTVGGNPLFIPETRLSIGNLFLALGNYPTMVFAPFGIEDAAPKNQVAEAYGQLKGMTGLIAEAQAKGHIRGFAVNPGETTEARLGAYVLTVQSARAARRRMLLDIGVRVPDDAPPSGQNGPGDPLDLRATGIVIQTGPEEFVLVGKDLGVSFQRADGSGVPEMDVIQEGRYTDGQWVPGRVLNGDERNQLIPSDRVGVVRVRMLQTK